MKQLQIFNSQMQRMTFIIQKLIIRNLLSQTAYLTYDSFILYFVCICSGQFGSSFHNKKFFAELLVCNREHIN